MQWLEQLIKQSQQLEHRKFGEKSFGWCRGRVSLNSLNHEWQRGSIWGKSHFRLCEHLSPLWRGTSFWRVTSLVLWKRTKSPESSLAPESASGMGLWRAPLPPRPDDEIIPLLFCNSRALGPRPPGSSVITPTEEGPRWFTGGEWKWGCPEGERFRITGS